MLDEVVARIVQASERPYSRFMQDGASARSSAQGAAIQATGDAPQEITMSTLSLSPQATPAIKFEFLNWLTTDPLPRDQTQSQRLHEPDKT